VGARVRARRNARAVADRSTIGRVAAAQFGQRIEQPQVAGELRRGLVRMGPRRVLAASVRVGAHDVAPVLVQEGLGLVDRQGNEFRGACRIDGVGSVDVVSAGRRGHGLCSIASRSARSASSIKAAAACSST
jgi:hypothetical protein